MALQQYFYRYTDEAHPASTAELIAAMEKQGYKANRKTIKDDIDILVAFDIDIVNGEVFAVCKILLESRAFSKKAMQSMLDCIINSCVSKSEQNLIRDQIHNEEYHYIETHNKTEIVSKMWAISQAIQKHLLINIDYLRTKDKKTVNRTVEPLAILFSEYYFYLLAFIPNDDVRKDFDVINDSSPTCCFPQYQAYEHNL